MKGLFSSKGTPLRKSYAILFYPIVPQKRLSKVRIWLKIFGGFGKMTAKAIVLPVLFVVGPWRITSEATFCRHLLVDKTTPVYSIFDIARVTIPLHSVSLE
jgi:hypothetical protein